MTDVGSSKSVMSGGSYYLALLYLLIGPTLIFKNNNVMNDMILTKVALRFLTVFLDVNREEIDMTSEVSISMSGLSTRLRCRSC